MGLSSCEKAELEQVPFVDRGIVIDFSTGKTKATVSDLDYESIIKHLDFFVFKADNTLFWHERVAVSATEGTHTLSVGTKYFAEKDAEGQVIGHPEYSVYLLANCTGQMSFDEQTRTLTLTSQAGTESQIHSLAALGGAVQETMNLHLAGLNLPSAPNSFLMDAVARREGDAQFPLSSEDSEKDIILDAELVRAAAKVVVDIIEGNNIEFTEGADLDDPSLFEETEHGLYYIRNLPYKTQLLAGYYDPLEMDVDRLVTTVKTNNAHFSWVPTTFRTDISQLKNEDSQRDQVRITTYVYEHNWDEKSLFEFEPYAVVNLPMVFLREKEGVVSYEAHPNSWYKIPLTKGNEFKRNHLYKVNVIINYAGATTVMEPVIIPDIEYEVLNHTNINNGWNITDINIQQTDRPKYLTISKEKIEMHNVQVSDAVEFTSSAPISLSILSAYYYDKMGQTKYVVASSTNGSGPSAGGITLSAPGGLTGRITVDSPIPENNTPLYIEVKVSNSEAEDCRFTVIQYPLEYITNTQGYYSYRDDFGGTTYETKASNRYVAATSWNESRQTWSYSNKGESNTSKFFSSKVADRKSDGSSTISYYNWSSTGRTPTKSTVSGLNNGRMYRVRLSSSSSEYSASVPKMDEKGWTDSGEDNSNLVSPSFMIASQLGATYAPSSVAQAASHCNQYVETYKDESGNVIHLKDWRLPTRAEIEIIIRFQYVPNAAMDEVLSGKSYWSATGAVSNPQSTTGSSGTTSAVRCIRNAF